MRHNIIVRLVVYYVVVLFAVSAVFYAFPAIGSYLAAERARQGGRAALELDHGAQAQELVPSLTGPAQLLDPERSIPIVVSLVVALAVALPVVWVYQWTRPRRRYNQTFAQTLLVVPIAITLVVFLVKGSLALAFSLAGIVAAVRFRTTLDEPIDAVYLFIVIGTGLAAGVQLLFVALIASVVFNAVVLAVWRLNLGSQPAVLQGWRLVPAPPAGQAAPPGPISAPAAASAEEPAERFNAILRLHVTNVEQAQALAVPLLDDRAKAWQVAEIAQEADGTSVVEFDLRLKKSVDLAAFVKEIEQGDPYVTRVELMKSKSKKPKEE
jgi:hypothetical protein